MPKARKAVIKHKKHKNSKFLYGHLFKSKSIIVITIFAIIGAGLTWRLLAATPSDLLPVNSPSWSFDVGRTIKVHPNGSGAIIMDDWGGMHPFKLGKNGTVPKIGTGGPYWKGWNIARDFVITDWSKGAGYVLDGFGGIHAFGGAPKASQGPYWKNWDIARKLVVRSDNKGGYIMDGFGGLHPFIIGNNSMPQTAKNGPYWKNWDIARDVVLNPNNNNGYVLDAFGGIHAFSVGNNTKPPAIKSSYYKQSDDARKLLITDWSKPTGYILIKNGKVYGFGSHNAASDKAINFDNFISMDQANGTYYALNRRGTILTMSPPNSLIFSEQQIEYFEKLEEQRQERQELEQRWYEAAARREEQQAAASRQALASVAACGKQTFQQGSKGECVKVIQTVLNNLGGYGLAIDGIFGPATAGAVKSYQCGVGIGSDGIVGPQTWSKMFSGARPSKNCGGRNSQTGSSNNAVAPTNVRPRCNSNCQENLTRAVEQVVNSFHNNDGVQMPTGVDDYDWVRQVFRF